jgi:phosphate transport system protein
MSVQHTVKAYDEELRYLDDMITEMGMTAADQLHSALEALLRNDAALAAHVIEREPKIDRLGDDIGHFAVRLIALRQPTGRDLRQVFSAFKIANDFERIGDYAANLAKRFPVLSERSPIELTRGILRMGELAHAMAKDILDAYVERDADKALALWHRDEELDRAHTRLFRELVAAMTEDPRNITACAHLLFIAKNLERIGDHATNIAETLHFIVRGDLPSGVRPKRDQTSLSQPLAWTPEPATQAR